MGIARSKVGAEPGNQKQELHLRMNPFAPVAAIPEGDFYRDVKDSNFELFRNGTEFIFIPHPSPSSDALITVKPGPNNDNESRNIYTAAAPR